MSWKDIWLRPRPHEKVIRALALVIFVLIIGTCGFKIIEGWRWFDSFYMTLITITTIGYGEPADISDAGRLFTSVLIVMGVAAVGYAIAVVGQSQLETFFRRRTRLMDKKLNALQGHIIVCGAGNTGSLILDELGNHPIPVVFIELNEARVEEMQEAGRFILHGDATEEAILQKAGIQRARSLITTLPSDADNFYITLSARELNPKIRIVSKANTFSAERKLKKYGANHVSMPERVGARHMMQGAIRPVLVDFMTTLSMEDENRYALEQFGISAGSPLLGKTLFEADFHKHYNIMIIAIQTRDGRMIVKPGPQDKMQDGDLILVLGTMKDLLTLEKEAGLRKSFEMPAS